MSRTDDRSAFFFFNDTATTEIYTLSLHDALPICSWPKSQRRIRRSRPPSAHRTAHRASTRDRKSTRLNSSHSQISYAVFCLKKKKNSHLMPQSPRQLTLTDCFFLTPTVS